MHADGKPLHAGNCVLISTTVTALLCSMHPAADHVAVDLRITPAHGQVHGTVHGVACITPPITLPLTCASLLPMGRYMVEDVL